MTITIYQDFIYSLIMAIGAINLSIVNPNKMICNDTLKELMELLYSKYSNQDVFQSPKEAREDFDRYLEIEVGKFDEENKKMDNFSLLNWMFFMVERLGRISTACKIIQFGSGIPEREYYDSIISLAVIVKKMEEFSLIRE